MMSSLGETIQAFGWPLTTAAMSGIISLSKPLKMRSPSDGSVNTRRFPVGREELARKTNGISCALLDEAQTNWHSLASD
jgi:hypothetical protein